MTERSQTLEERRVLNPAFAGSLICRAASGFQETVQVGLPFVYSYIVLPIVIHPATRERMPVRTDTRLINWAERNPDVMTTFLRRVADLRNVSREGLLLITSSGMAEFGDCGSVKFTGADRAIRKAETSSPSSEVTDCMKRAHFLGRWLAVSGAPAAVLTALGLRI